MDRRKHPSASLPLYVESRYTGKRYALKAHARHVPDARFCFPVLAIMFATAIICRFAYTITTMNSAGPLTW
jgi:hypothetical protein